MEEVPGIPGLIPILAPYPTQAIRDTVLPDEWLACLDSWISCVQFRLRLTAEHFLAFKLSQAASGIPFLLSYLQSAAYARNVSELTGAEARLRKCCISLLRRLLLATRTPLDCSTSTLFELLANASQVLSKSIAWRDTLVQSWKKSSSEISAAVDSCKGNVVRLLTINNARTSQDPVKYLGQAIALTKALPRTGLIFMTGSDYLEALARGYGSTEAFSQPLTEHAFLCLRSLMSSTPPQTSILIDQIYFLKSLADHDAVVQSTLLSNLIVSTSFLRHLDTHLSLLQNARGRQLLETLHNYREHCLHLHPPPPLGITRARKGKDKARADDDMHMHSASQISQVHDLFPDLTSSYIMRLLDHFLDDVESVIAALLEPDSLPPDLKDQHHAKEPESNLNGMRYGLTPKPVVPQLPRRKNVFDGDDFDSLRISSERLHQGRRDRHNQPPTAEEHARSKAAIMTALAAFDADDDERDDSYDVADVGGTVDDTVDTDDRKSNEEFLFSAWRDHPEMFARDSKTRLSQPRQQIKRETGMADEQLEGWAVVLQRDETMQKRLKQKYDATASFKSNQSTMSGSRWRIGESDSEDTGASSGQDDTRRMGMAQIRGSRQFGGRGSGRTSGPGSEHATQMARKRKEQGRGRSGVNHSRREGRAKKMGRGMAGGLV